VVFCLFVLFCCFFHNGRRFQRRSVATVTQHSQKAFILRLVIIAYSLSDVAYITDYWILENAIERLHDFVNTATCDIGRERLLFAKKVGCNGYNSLSELLIKRCFVVDKMVVKDLGRYVVTYRCANSPVHLERHLFTSLLLLL